MSVPTAPRRRFYRGRLRLRLLVLNFWKCDEGEGGGGGRVVITNQKMWFVTGFVCDAWDRREEGVGRRSLKYQQHRPPAIHRQNTLHTLHTNFLILLSLSTGYRHHLSIYIHLNTKYPGLVRLLTYLSVPVPSPGRRWGKKVTARRISAFISWPGPIAQHMRAYSQAPALYRIVS